MARFHIYQLRFGAGLVMDLQAGLLDDLKSRVVAPLVPTEIAGRSINRLTPLITLADRSYSVAMHLMSAIPVSDIGDMVLDATDQGDKFTAAIDMVFQGF
ncbi:CcdB family protein [Rhizobium sp. RCC_161_2]|uniref:CcdB family protein n=1 Tax=Rhizobium sp. RCC_161_2 TaxID=3239219 RepID=UPI003523FBB1